MEDIFKTQKMFYREMMTKFLNEKGYKTSSDPESLRKIGLELAKNNLGVAICHFENLLDRDDESALRCILYRSDIPEGWKIEVEELKKEMEKVHRIFVGIFLCEALDKM